MKAKLIDLSKSYEYYNKYKVKIDKSQSAHVTVSASIYKLQELEEYDLDLRDTEIEYFINNVKTTYSGYKELYTKLYGDKAYNELTLAVENTAIDKFTQDITEHNLIQNIGSVKAKKYINKLLKNVDKYPIMQTKLCDDEYAAPVWYSSNYMINKLAKVIDKKLVINHNCVPSYRKDDRKSTHCITILDSIISKSK